MSTRKPTSKPVAWIGTTLEDLRAFPKEARKKIGDALRFAQLGAKHPAAKPHAFQKKSTRGIETPHRHLALIRQRLKVAEQDHRARKGGK